MAVSESTGFSGPYTANGATTAFPFTFEVLSTNQVAVISRVSGVDSVVNPSAYTVSLTGTAPSAGTVTFTSAPTTGQILVILDPAFESDAGFENGSAWLAKPVNDGYDEAALRDQALRRDVARGLSVPLGEAGLSLPAATDRAGFIWGFNDSGGSRLYSVADFRGAQGEPGGNIMAVGLATDIPAFDISVGTDALRTSGYAAIGAGAAFYVSDGVATGALMTAHPRAVFQTVNGRYFRLAPDARGAVPVEAFKASGDADDTAAVYQASLYAKAIGATTITGSPRKWSIASQPQSVTTYGDWTSFAEGVVFEPDGAILRGLPVVGGDGALRGLDYRGWIQNDNSAGVVTAAIAAGANQVAITDATNYNVGDWVLYQLGDVAYDPAETYLHGMARVTAKSGNTLTLDVNFPRPFTSGDIAAANNNKFVRRVHPMNGRYFGDIIFDTDLTGGYTGCEHAVVIKQAINCRFGVVGGRGLGVGAFIAQYCYNLHIDAIFNSASRISGTDQGNGGRFAEARAIKIGQYVMRDIDRSAIALEGASVVEVDYLEDDSNGYGGAGGRTCIVLNGRSHLSVGRMLVSGKGGQIILNAIDNSQFTVGHLHIRTDSWPVSVPRLGAEITEKLTLEIAGAAPEVYSVDQGYWHVTRFDLVAGVTQVKDCIPPNHILGGIRIFGSTGSSVSSFRVYRNGAAAGTDNLDSYFQAGKWAVVDVKSGTFGSKTNVQDRDQGITVDCTGNTGSTGTYALIALWVIPAASVDQYSGTFAQSDIAAAHFYDDAFPARELIAVAVPDLAAGVESDWINVNMSAGANVVAAAGKGMISGQGLPYNLAVTYARVHPSANVLQFKIKNFHATTTVVGATYNFRAEYWA